jgi:hypothetical protein
VWYLPFQEQPYYISLSLFLQIAELLARAGLWQPYQDFMKDRQDARQRGRGSK